MQSKDQSYVLYYADAGAAGAHAPVRSAAMHKTRGAPHRGGAGLRTTPRSTDSQDICFVPDGDYAGFHRALHGQRDCPAGDFVDESGRVLGRHKGIVHYTVGQRKGLGIAADAPLYVKRIDAAEKPRGAERQRRAFFCVS